jgi:hypothetical protein
MSRSLKTNGPTGWTTTRTCSSSTSDVLVKYRKVLGHCANLCSTKHELNIGLHLWISSSGNSDFTGFLVNLTASGRWPGLVPCFFSTPRHSGITKTVHAEKIAPLSCFRSEALRYMQPLPPPVGKSAATWFSRYWKKSHWLG